MDKFNPLWFVCVFIMAAEAIAINELYTELNNCRVELQHATELVTIYSDERR